MTTKFALGKWYKMQLIREEGGEDDVLFKNDYVNDTDWHVFRVMGLVYETTERLDDDEKVVTMDRALESIETNHDVLSADILRTTRFELLPHTLNRVKVDCGSYMCREPHYLSCRIVDMTDEEIGRFLDQQREREEERKQQREKREEEAAKKKEAKRVEREEELNKEKV